MKLYLVRHGQSERNVGKKIYTGQTDVNLTEVGVEQAQAIRPILAPISFDRVYSSDLIRAIRTQENALPFPNPVRTPLIREYDVGELAGKAVDEIVQKYGNDHGKRRDYTGFGGENNAMVDARVGAFLKELEENPAENVAAFTHNGTLVSFLRHVLKADVISPNAAASNNCAIHVMEYDGKAWKLLAWNYMGKL